MEQLLIVLRAEADSNRLHAKRDRNRSGNFTERDKGMASGDGCDRVTEALLGQGRGWPGYHFGKVYAAAGVLTGAMLAAG